MSCYVAMLCKCVCVHGFWTHGRMHAWTNGRTDVRTYARLYVISTVVSQLWSPLTSVIRNQNHLPRWSYHRPEQNCRHLPTASSMPKPAQSRAGNRGATWTPWPRRSLVTPPSSGLWARCRWCDFRSGTSRPWTRGSCRNHWSIFCGFLGPHPWLSGGSVKIAGRTHVSSLDFQ